MSPDGGKLLFRGGWDGISGNGDEEIFTANADGSGVTRLTHDDVEDSSPNWSPDGSKIAPQHAVDGAGPGSVASPANPSMTSVLVSGR